MDLPHAYQPFMVATPLMIYIIYRAVTRAERWIRSRLPEARVGWVTAHPVGIAVLIFFVVFFWGPLHTQVDSTPAGYRPTVAAPAAFARVGYASSVRRPCIRGSATDRRRIPGTARPADGHHRRAGAFLLLPRP